ncbi:MAG: hypothetical protein WBW99_15540, partial [Pseudolabrys sp.]
FMSRRVNETVCKRMESIDTKWVYFATCATWKGQVCLTVILRFQVVRDNCSRIKTGLSIL